MTWQSVVAQALLLESALLLFFVVPAFVAGGWAGVRTNLPWLRLFAVGFVLFPILIATAGRTVGLVLSLLLGIGGWAYSRVRPIRVPPEVQQFRQEWRRRHRVLLWVWSIALFAYIFIGSWLVTELTS